MIPLRLKWAGQGPVSLAEDLELLRLMRRSGCVGLLIGFESVQKETHDGMKKIKSLKIDFSEAIRRFHDEGIAILGLSFSGLIMRTKMSSTRHLNSQSKTVWIALNSGF